MPNLPSLESCTIAIIGLGYVGLPLAVEFSRNRRCLLSDTQLKRSIIGFDINNKRLLELQNGRDTTNEINSEDLGSVVNLKYTSNPDLLALADVFIVTVPTPIDSVKRPDLTPLIKASEEVGRALKSRSASVGKSDAIVIYESTVYPGATEEICVPILEKESALQYNKQFYCGYSPERINPGDTEHKLTTITKVTSGSTDEVATWVDSLYGSIISAGTHKASSLKVAEAAKVIENTQRDLNIALVNELAVIFGLMDIDTIDVLEAAGSKWNFLPFRPGLVGGHCIGVDPYYLTHKAEQLGYHPQVVLAGRRINDGMGFWLAEKLVLNLAKRRIELVNARVLILGLSFKENCPDLRNTKVVDLVAGLQRFGMHVDVVDPWINKLDAQSMYNIETISSIPQRAQYSAVVLAVAHQEFVLMNPSQWTNLLGPSGVILDMKGIVSRSLNPIRL